MLLVPELVSTEPSNGELTFGYFTEPTPRAANTTGVANPGPVIRDVTENPVAFARDESLPTPNLPVNKKSESGHCHGDFIIGCQFVDGTLLGFLKGGKPDKATKSGSPIK